MSTFYYVKKNDGDYIFDNFPVDLKTLVFSLEDNQKNIEILLDKQKVPAKLGKKSNNYGTVYVLTTDSRYINRQKLFRELIDVSLLAIEPLSKFQNDLIADQARKTEEFIHNVTSLNSYSIQDLFSLVPEKILGKNINKQTDVVKALLSEKPNMAVKTFLKLIKYNLAMKVEFSVFERTLQKYPGVQMMDYEIRKIVLSVLQIFIDEFEERKITVSLESCEKRISLDHDSFFVSLYYLFDNSVKYCCTSTDYKISFKEEHDSFAVLFNMISIKISDDEVVKLVERGYRSNYAKLLNEKGGGIGMYRILKTLKFNDAELVITPRVNIYKKQINNIEYEGNEFKIKFLGKQDWFRTNLIKKI